MILVLIVMLLHDFSVDYNAITVNDILDIHKFLIV